MDLQVKKQMQKRRRKARVRVAATSERPRLSVFRSLKEIYAQIIDNGKGATLVSVSTKEIKDKKNKTESAQDAGKLLAEKAIAKGIKKVVFDRSSYQYHGRVKALADGAREGGLEF